MELLEELDDDSVCEELVELEDGSMNMELDELVDSPDDIDIDCVDCNDEDNSTVEDGMNIVDVSDDMGNESDRFDVVL